MHRFLLIKFFRLEKELIGLKQMVFLLNTVSKQS